MKKLVLRCDFPAFLQNRIRCPEKSYNLCYSFWKTPGILLLFWKQNIPALAQKAGTGMLLLLLYMIKVYFFALCFARCTLSKIALRIRR